MRIIASTNEPHSDCLTGVYGAVVARIGDFIVSRACLSDGSIPTGTDGVCIVKSGGPISDSDITGVFNGDKALHTRSPGIIHGEGTNKVTRGDFPRFKCL